MNKEETIIVSISSVLYFIIPIIVFFMLWKKVFLKNTSLDDVQKSVVATFMSIICSAIFWILMSYNWRIIW